MTNTCQRFELPAKLKYSYAIRAFSSGISIGFPLDRDLFGVVTSAYDLKTLAIMNLGVIAVLS